MTFPRASHTIAAEPTCSGASRDSYLGSRIDCRQKIWGYGTRQLSSWGQSAILAFRFSYEQAGASGDSCMALCGLFCVTAVESPDPFSSKDSGSPFTILWICDTLILEGVPLEILAAGSPVWLLISSPSAIPDPLWSKVWFSDPGPISSGEGRLKLQTALSIVSASRWRRVSPLD